MCISVSKVEGRRSLLAPLYLVHPSFCFWRSNSYHAPLGLPCIVALCTLIRRYSILKRNRMMDDGHEGASSAWYSNTFFKPRRSLLLSASTLHLCANVPLFSTKAPKYKLHEASRWMTICHLHIAAFVLPPGHGSSILRGVCFIRGGARFGRPSRGGAYAWGVPAFGVRSSTRGDGSQELQGAGT